MRQNVYIGTTPYEEESSPYPYGTAAIGTERFDALNLAQCQAFRDQLREMFGSEPEGASLRIRRESHEYGTYREVSCEYDDSNEAAMNYAFRCEAEAPAYWSAKAKAAIHRYLA